VANGLGSVAFVDPQRGFAVGLPDVILYTEDGGESWLNGSNRAELPSFARGMFGLTAVRFSDATHGVILGRGVTDLRDSKFGFHTEGFVLRTEDGGQSWVPAPIMSEIPLARGGGSEGGSFTTVCFTPEGAALIAGNPPLLSQDGGATWTNIEERLVPDGDGPRWSTAHDAPQGAACLPGGRLWLATPRTVFGSVDAGATWAVLSEPPGGSIFAHIAFREPQTGWLTKGRVLRSVDGGFAWSAVDNAISPLIGSGATFFISDTELLSTSFTAVSVSRDAGATWQVFNVPTPNKVFGLADVAVIE